jgi:hypothetical protein
MRGRVALLLPGEPVLTAAPMSRLARTVEDIQVMFDEAIARCAIT